MLLRTLALPSIWVAELEFNLFFLSKIFYQLPRNDLQPIAEYLFVKLQFNFQSCDHSRHLPSSDSHDGRLNPSI